ncbi:MAG: GxxExxY protein [Candidatus Omnitrophota bacterium]|nr:GxxExxY protein [Candidatus Omnitrophota bacterium]
MTSDKLLYKDLAYKIVGCFYEVYNQLGPAHKEQIYHKALTFEFKSKEVPFTEKKRLKVKYKDQEIGIYEPDFIIDDKIIIEIKSVLNMPTVFEKQLYYYLEGTAYKLGYLVNFGSDKLDIKRRAYDTARLHSR